MTIQQAFELALHHHQAGQLKEAEAVYQQILAVDPRHVDSLENLGLIAQQMGRNDFALELIRRAISFRPRAEAYSNLGTILSDSGQADAAIASYRQALVLNPSYAEAHNNLGVEYYNKGQFDDAIAAYQMAIRLNPRHPLAHNNLGNCFRKKGQLGQSVASYRQAISVHPNYPEVYNNLGNSLKDQGQLDEAIEAYRRSIALNPTIAEVYNNLGNALKETGHQKAAIEAYQRARATNPDLVEAHSNLVMMSYFTPGLREKEIASEQSRWNQQHAEPLRHVVQVPRNDRSSQRRLRIGYVSPDFRDHVIGRNMVPLFLNHDKSQVEVFAYSDVVAPDFLTAQFEKCSDQWRTIVGRSDEEVANQIREDEIDILIDLTLHLAGNRLLVFARKPAPIQVTFAGYPGSTGMTAIDYRFTDPHLDPVGRDETIYAEKTVRLPDTFWCYDALDDDEISVGSPPCLQTGYITFGCLNNFCKINDVVLRLWSLVLRAVPSSHLLLLAPEGGHRSVTLDLLAREGIGMERVEFVAHLPRREYLKTYQRIDIGLDTLPYNGHTTSLDSLWMGVPVVTLVGETLVGRAGFSQLNNLGLPECIATTVEQFTEIAVNLAGDPERLSEWRAGLRAKMQGSALMDSARFARAIETGYREMWQELCKR